MRQNAVVPSSLRKVPAIICCTLTMRKSRSAWARFRLRAAALRQSHWPAARNTASPRQRSTAGTAGAPRYRRSSAARAMLSSKSAITALFTRTSHTRSFASLRMIITLPFFLFVEHMTFPNHFQSVSRRQKSRIDPTARTIRKLIHKLIIRFMW